MAYVENPNLTPYEFPPESRKITFLTGISYEKDINGLGSMNFTFGNQHTGLKVFEPFNQKTQTFDELKKDELKKDEVKKDQMIQADLARQEDLPTKYAKIKYFKTYSEPRQYGEKLCGFRAYDKEEECVLSAGWFDP